MDGGGSTRRENGKSIMTTNNEDTKLLEEAERALERILVVCHNREDGEKRSAALKEAEAALIGIRLRLFS